MNITLNGQFIAFSVFAIVSIVSALLVVTLKNILHAAYFLVLTMLSIGGIYIALSADFLGIAQILIYGGAVIVVVIFAIMLTGVPGKEVVMWNAQRPFAVFLGLAVAVTLILLLVKTPWVIMSPALGGINMKRFTLLIFGKYLIPFEVISLLLLVAMIGAIFFAKKAEGEE